MSQMSAPEFEFACVGASASASASFFELSASLSLSSAVTHEARRRLVAVAGVNFACRDGMKPTPVSQSTCLTLLLVSYIKYSA